MFSDEELTAAIAAGTVQPADFFWREGMTEWAPIEAILQQPTQSTGKPAAPSLRGQERPASEKQLAFIESLSGKRPAGLTSKQASEMIDQWLTVTKPRNGPIPENWENEPASAAQFELIHKLGGNPEPAISKAQASRLIDALKVQQRQREEEAAREKAEEMEKLASAFPSHYLFLRVQEAEKQLAKTLTKSAKKINKCIAAVQDAKQEVPLIHREIADKQSELHRARASLESSKADEEREEILGDIEDIESNISEAKQALQEDLRDANTDLRKAKAEAMENEKDGKEQVAVAKRDRVNWWLAALTGNTTMFDCFEIAPYSLLDKIAEYYEGAGRGFKRPTIAQVSAILDALDQGRPGWDKGTAKEQFFGVLSMNFPTLRRFG